MCPSMSWVGSGGHHQGQQSPGKVEPHAIVNFFLQFSFPHFPVQCPVSSAQRVTFYHILEFCLLPFALLLCVSCSALSSGSDGSIRSDFFFNVLCLM